MGLPFLAMMMEEPAFALLPETTSERDTRQGHGTVMTPRPRMETSEISPTVVLASPLGAHSEWRKWGGVPGKRFKKKYNVLAVYNVKGVTPHDQVGFLLGMQGWFMQDLKIKVTKKIYYRNSLYCGSAGKESTCKVGDPGSIPGLGRSPGEGKGYPLQYSGLENSMD